VKGVQSLVRTLDLLKTYQALLSNSTMVGVIPFRAKWVGLNPTKTTKESIAVMEELVGKELMLPNLLESDIYKRAINEQVLPRDIGKEDLEYPITSLLDKIQPYLSADVTSVINNHEPTR